MRPTGTAPSVKLLHCCETALGGVGVYQKYLSGIPNSELCQAFLMPEPHARIMEGDPRVETYPMRRRGAGAVLTLIRRLLQRVRREHPDVVVFHSTFSLFALLALRLTPRRQPRPRLLYLAHGWAGEQYGEGAKARLVRKIEGRLCGLADLVINVSQNDLEIARRHRYRGRHVVIENAVPDRAAQTTGDRFAEAPDTLHLLFVGRFDRQKGLDILLDAFARARARRPDLALHLIGDAVRNDRPETLPGQVDTIGWVPRDEIDSWYSSADAVVVPSRWEGLPLVIPEAMRNGTPVLASNRSGMAQLFETGVQGISFEPTPETLADLLGGLDREALAAMRPACRALYEERYAIGRLYADFLRVIDDQMRAAGRGAQAAHGREGRD